MIIFYDPASLAVTHIITLHAMDYDPAIQGEPYVEHDPINPLAVEIVRTNGVIEVRERQGMTIKAPETCQVGVEFAIEGIAAGVDIFVNDRKLAIMDDTSVLEFTAATAGYYTFRFQGSGWMTTGVRIEALS
jgi:hypothetical protein